MAGQYAPEQVNSLVEYLFHAEFPFWHAYALCNDKPKHWFFGHEPGEGKKRHRPTMTISEIKRAKAVCNECPVQAKCLDFALTNHQVHGIWGGTTGRERQRYWREQKVVVIS